MKNLDFELLTDEFMLQTIGFSNLNKLLFTSAHLKKRCHCETSAHTGRGNPPVLLSGLLGRLSVFLGFLKIRGIATSLRSSQ